MTIHRFKTGVIAAVLVAVVTASLFAQKGEPNLEDTLKALREECRAELAAVVEQQKQSFILDPASIEFEQVIAAQVALMQFDLENETDPVRRVKLLEETLEVAHSQEKRTAVQFTQGVVSSADARQAKVFRLRTQIKLLLEKQKLLRGPNG